MTNRWGNNANSDRFYSLGSNSLWTVTTTTKLKEAFPWKKSYDKPRQQIKKQKHYFANKCIYSQSYGFSSSSVWMWEFTTIKKAEHWRIDLNCGAGEDSWRVPWTVRRSNLSILKEINPEYLLENVMLKLKLQYFGHLMQRADQLEKTLMQGKVEGKRRRGGNRGQDGCMASLSQWT